MNNFINEKIREIVEGNKVVIFMKGTPESPQCGFSARSVQCLNAVGASIKAIDVLSDEDLRAGVKEYTKWPTIPQIFINGKFVGGCDIISEMFEKGDLKKAVID